MSEKRRKHKRLPNGFGQISKINNPNLRKPYRAMVTIGRDAEGKLIKKLLKPVSYFATYNEAYAALLEYNKDPYALDTSMTMAELYEKWSSEYFKTLKSSSSERCLKSAWSYCSDIYRVKVSVIRARHLKQCIENAHLANEKVCQKASPGVKSRIKSLFNLMFDYALEYELVEKNYARIFKITGDIRDEIDDNKKDHMSFTDEEIDKLWNNVDSIPYVDVILYQCYSGWRPQELGLIEVENVNLEDGYVIGGMKTDAGTNRMVPIHPRVENIIKSLYEKAVVNHQKYLIESNGLLTYDKYKTRFANVKKILKLDDRHRPHDPRKHFITMAKNAGVDEYAIKRIVGHSISDITEKVYTDRSIEWLKKESIKID